MCAQIRVHGIANRVGALTRSVRNWIFTRERRAAEKFGLEGDEPEPPIQLALYHLTAPTWEADAWFWRERGRGKRWRTLATTPELKWARNQTLERVKAWADGKGFTLKRIS